MAGFEQTVAVPSTSAYAPPTPDIFAQVAGLPDAYYRGQFNQQQRELNDQAIRQGQIRQDIAQTFRGGLPTNADGTIDYGRAVSMLAQKGDPNAIFSGADAVFQQRAAAGSPLLNGGAAAQPTVSPDVASTASKIVQVESGGDPNATNPKSSATGLGQFTDGTWLDTIKKHFPNLAQGRSDDQLLAMRKIPQLAQRMTEAFTADNQAGLTKADVPVTPATSYLAHFLGLGGAVKVLKADPNTPVSKLLSADAIKANPFLKDMSARDLESWAARKMAGPAMVAQNAQAAPGNASPSNGQVQVADASGALPPSANAGTPGAPAAPPRAQPAAPAPVQPQPQQPTAQAPAAPQPQPQPVQPQGGPIVPQVPLPKGFTDPQAAILALRSEAARYAAVPHGQGTAQQLTNWAERIEKSIQPVKMGQYDTYVDPRNAGRVVAEGPGAAMIRATESAGNSATLDADAERYRQTGQLPPNMGRGVQGAAEARAIRQRATDMEIASGGDPATWPGRWQDYRAQGVGKSAGERVRANREENLNLILKAADAAIPAALEASKALPRGSFVPFNKLIQKGEIMSSDPRLVEFGMANLQLAEHWARAMNPTGVMRESDRDKALSFLDTAYSNNTYERAVMQLQKQITRERDAVHGGGTILKDNKAPAPGDNGSGTVSKDGWTVVTGPNGKKARIQEVTE